MASHEGSSLQKTPENIQDSAPENTKESTPVSEQSTSHTLRMKIPKPIIENVEGGKIEISWGEIQDAKEYEVICVKKINGKEQQWNFVTKDRGYIIDGVDPGYEYQLHIEGDGEVSEIATVFSGPSPPANVKGVPDPSSPCDTVCVTFDDPDEHPKSYKVVIVDSEGMEDERCSEKTSVTFRGLKPGHDYIVYVQSVHRNPYPGAKELFSRKTYAPVEIKTYPEKVTIESTEYLGNGFARMRWSDREGATEYDVEWTDGENDAVKRLHSKNVITIGGLAPGKRYSIVVAARNKAGRGPFSDAEEILTEPPPPAGLRVSHFDRSPHDSVLVSVDEPDVKDEQFAFVAKPLNKERNERNVPPSSSSCAIIDHLVPGEVYQICAVAIQHELKSKEKVYEKLVHMYPDQPVNIKGFINGGCLRVKWDELEVKPSKYEIEIEENGKRFTEYSVKNQFSRKCIKPSTMYQLRVAGINDGGRGRFSEDILLYTDPAPPTNARIEHDKISPKTSLIVTFDDDDSVSKSYEITAEPTRRDGEDEKTITTKEKMAFLHGLTPGRKYSVKVVAVTEDPDGKRRASVPAYCIPK